MTIHLLDKSTIDKIAAGEVVERPSNVVKELMENSIDSGASSISVEIRDGGRSLIRITDNGCGIPADQVRLAFLRHATSKISNAEDLSFVTSLGFRGEALSSIAAVSDLELCTKTADSDAGTLYRIRYGEEALMEDAGLPDGTTLIIRDLFENVPARLKFLSSAQTEANYVTEAVEKIALSHPGIAVKYTNNGAVRLNTSGNGSLKDVIYSIFGKEIASDLLEVSFEGEPLSVSGYIGKPEIQRSSRAYENFFVNGRYVKDKILSAAVESAYRGYQMKGSFPFVVLNIKIEPELMDVNVHPTKREIRFSDQQGVYNIIYEIVHDAITRRESIPAFRISDPVREEQERAAEQVIHDRQLSSAPEPFEYVRKDIERDILRETSDYDAGSAEPDNATYEQQTLFNGVFLDESARIKHKLIGEVFDTYWIVEYDDSMFIIDQHAAHEKVNYERFMNRIRSGNVTSQIISPGVLITLSASEETCLLKHLDRFRKLGFDIEHFGGKDYMLTAVPVDFYDLNTADLFISFLDELNELPNVSDPDMLTDRIATAACKASVKGGNKISVQEADRLIDELLSLDNPYNCPHGRPTIITMSKYEMEKNFKRII